VITVDFDRLAIAPGFMILDVGCGSGRHVCAASRFRDVVAIGADIRFDDAREARKRLRQIEQLGEAGGGQASTLTADIHRLPFGNDVFDLVICSEVLEHVHKPHTAVSEAVRVLKQGGNLWVLCVCDNPWVTMAETAELVLSLFAIEHYDTAELVFGWLTDKRYDDGAFWTGLTFPDGEIFTREKTAWTAAAVLLAADTLYDLTPASGIFKAK
jgi:ubiquinone/menaquinone biosynthesis C-methylase UbiE